MPAATRFRHSLFQEVAQCLMRLVEAKSPADGIDALAGFFEGLPIVWHTVDVFADGRARKRLSRSCPRGFASFVTRVGFLKRQDGTYQGTFADSTLVLVKVSAPAAGDQCLVAAIGLTKRSPLNDGAIIACIGAVIHEALSRVFWFEAHAQRSAMLESFAVQNDEFMALFDSRGTLVERYPGNGHAPLPANLFPATVAERRRARSQHAVLTADGRAYNTHARWIASGRPLEGRYWLVHAKTRSAAPRAVADRLESYGLSKRESQVAELVFTGKTNRRIAEALFISRDTVKTHCKHIFGKLGISRRTEFLRLISQG